MTYNCQECMIRTISLFLIVLNVACQYEARFGGDIKASKDQVSWRAKATAVFEPAFGDSLISVAGQVFNGQGFKSEEMAFLKIPPRVGSYKVVKGGGPATYKDISISYTLLEGHGDVISQYQTLDTSYQNTFSVDAYDVSSRTLKASFECRMMFVSQTKDTTYTLFENGSINVAIEDY